MQQLNLSHFHQSLLLLSMAVEFDATTGSVTRFQWFCLLVLLLLTVFITYLMLTIIFIFIICLAFDAATGSVTFSPLFVPYLLMTIIIIFIFLFYIQGSKRISQVFVNICSLCNTDNDNDNHYWYNIWYGNWFYDFFFSLDASVDMPFFLLSNPSFGPTNNSLMGSCSISNCGLIVGEFWWCHFTNCLWSLSHVDINHHNNKNFVFSHLMQQLILCDVFSGSICWRWLWYWFQFRSVC